MAKKKQLLSSYKLGQEFHINVPKETTEQELSFVISRVLMFMVKVYADSNDMTFKRALELYKESIASNVQMQYDIEHKGDEL